MNVKEILIESQKNMPKEGLSERYVLVSYINPNTRTCAVYGVFTDKDLAHDVGLQYNKMVFHVIFKDGSFLSPVGNMRMLGVDEGMKNFGEMLNMFQDISEEICQALLTHAKMCPRHLPKPY